MLLLRLVRQQHLPLERGRTGRAAPGSAVGLNRVPNARGAAAGRSAGFFFGSRYGTKKWGQGDRAASRGGLLNAL